MPTPLPQRQRDSARRARGLDYNLLIEIARSNESEKKKADSKRRELRKPPQSVHPKLELWNWSPGGWFREGPPFAQIFVHLKYQPDVPDGEL